MFGENPDFEYKDVSPNTMRVIPINFNRDAKDMLTKLHHFMYKGLIAIPKEHNDLITSLGTAYAEELNLKKDQTSYDDSLDALRLSLKGYSIK